MVTDSTSSPHQAKATKSTLFLSYERNKVDLVPLAREDAGSHFIMPMKRKGHSLLRKTTEMLYLSVQQNRIVQVAALEKCAKSTSTYQAIILLYRIDVPWVKIDRAEDHI